MKIKDLIIEHVTGKPSHTKFWSNIANAVITGGIITSIVRDSLSPEIVLIYLAFVGYNRTASQLLALRAGVAPKLGDKPADTQG